MSSEFAGKMEEIKNGVTGVLGAVTTAFENWSPNMKMPHFSVEMVYDEATQTALPQFSVEWYAKAMDSAMILDKPTIFGYSANSGSLLGGGEAGQEVVAGTNTLMNMIKTAVSTQNADIVSVLSRILSAIIELNNGMPASLRKALEDLSLELNNREFARLVKAVN